MICSLKWGGLTLLESYLISLSFVVNRDGDSVHEYYHCVPEDLIPNQTSKEHGTGQPSFSQVQISFPN